jgi:ABC-2 type transport system permease protein
MSRAIASELLKLRTTRTFFGLVAGALLLVGGVTALAASLATYEGPGVAPGEDLAGLAGFAPMFALVLGLLAVSGELRHGTITPTLLAVPSRARLVAAKVVAHLVAGFVLGLVAVLLDLLLAEAIFSLRGIETGTSLSEALRWTAGLSAASALAAALGVGIGAVVRNQVGAFAWVLIVESLLTIAPVLEEPVTKFGIGGLIDGVDGIAVDDSGNVLAQLPAGLVLIGYAAVFALAGAALLRRRDIT